MENLKRWKGKEKNGEEPISNQKKAILWQAPREGSNKIPNIAIYFNKSYIARKKARRSQDQKSNIASFGARLRSENMKRPGSHVQSRTKNVQCGVFSSLQ